MAENTMTTAPFAAYEKQSEYQAEVAQMVEALRAECERLGLPMLCAVCFAQEADGANHMALTTHFVAADATPAELRAAAEMVKGDAEAAFTTLTHDAARRAVAGVPANAEQDA